MGKTPPILPTPRKAEKGTWLLKKKTPIQIWYSPNIVGDSIPESSGEGLILG